jgi:hypothetical protein
MKLNSSEVRDVQNIPLTQSFKMFELEDHLEKLSMTRGPEQAAYAVCTPTKSATRMDMDILRENPTKKQITSASQEPSVEAATN